jgi:hypothetical protein
LRHRSSVIDGTVCHKRRGRATGDNDRFFPPAGLALHVAQQAPCAREVLVEDAAGDVEKSPPSGPRIEYRIAIPSFWATTMSRLRRTAKGCDPIG